MGCWCLHLAWVLGSSTMNMFLTLYANFFNFFFNRGFENKTLVWNSYTNISFFSYRPNVPPPFSFPRLPYLHRFARQSSWVIATLTVRSLMTMKNWLVLVRFIRIWEWCELLLHPLWRPTPYEDPTECNSSLFDFSLLHFDGIFLYFINAGIQKAIQAGIVKREELFITSKLWNNDRTPELIKSAIKTTLTDLGVDYLDLYLIHWPINWVKGPDGNSVTNNGIPVEDKTLTIPQVYQEMEKLYSQGLVKALGLSNFDETEIEDIMKVATVKPVVNQVECHPLWNQFKLENGMFFTSFWNDVLSRILELYFFFSHSNSSSIFITILFPSGLLSFPFSTIFHPQQWRSTTWFSSLILLSLRRLLRAWFPWCPDPKFCLLQRNMAALMLRSSFVGNFNTVALWFPNPNTLTAWKQISIFSTLSFLKKTWKPLITSSHRLATTLVLVSVVLPLPSSKRTK